MELRWDSENMDWASNNLSVEPVPQRWFFIKYLYLFIYLFIYIFIYLSFYEVFGKISGASGFSVLMKVW